jgi:hypothetical protein
MDFETLLTTTPADQWKTRQAIIFDWYDGPRAGVCALAHPAVEFSFQLLDERPTADDLDDRLFRVSELPLGSVDEVLSTLQPLGHPTGPYWVPIWRFPDESERLKAEQHLQLIEARKRSTSLVIYTRDMVAFLGCWLIGATVQAPEDWFALLNTLKRQPA